MIEFENPIEHGWDQSGNHYEIQFFDGKQFPDNVADLEIDPIEYNEDNEEMIDDETDESDEENNYDLNDCDD